MATNWKYIPVLGNFDPSAFLLLVGGEAVPRDTSVYFQGVSRPGVLKWVLKLTCSDDSAVDQDALTFVVQTPFPVTTDIGSLANPLNQNSVMPLVVLTPLDPLVYDQKIAPYVPQVSTQQNIVSALGVVADALNPNALFAVGGVTVGVPSNQEVSFFLNIDFSHSLIN
jgi:hypothetical protein